MCHPPKAVAKVANIAGAVLNPVSLLANAGGFGAIKGAIAGGKQGGVKGAVAGSITGAEGGVTDPVGTVTGVPTQYGPDDTPPAGPSGSDAGAPPIPVAPNPTETAAMAAKRRMNAMRMGLLSTITTSGSGVTSAPSLFQPAAYAASGKTALGQ